MAIDSTHRFLEAVTSAGLLDSWLALLQQQQQQQPQLGQLGQASLLVFSQLPGALIALWRMCQGVLDRSALEAAGPRRVKMQCCCVG
ncbi:hypothetical protein OEZ85_001455 [Tetradesmus obliquus]|uniref:Uncharacterized protein n=1 Tax=Tetradesmus obliquus TaxID=3088 RepID=A0ABY8UU93_TETOB|nr:hypothetical protein OEZ85_001455 [Tetradesmus obliquus]